MQYNGQCVGRKISVRKRREVYHDENVPALSLAQTKIFVGISLKKKKRFTIVVDELDDLIGGNAKKMTRD